MGLKERKEKEKELRRKVIQEAAHDLFISKGFRATTMEDIAQKAELSAGTIYYYFPDKDHLYVSLNEKSLRFWHTKATKVYKNKRLSVEKKMQKFMDILYETYQKEPFLLGNVPIVQMETSLSLFQGELVDQLNQIFREIKAMMADVYEEGVRQGKFVDNKGTVISDIIWSLFSGVVLFEETKKKLNPKKDFVKSTLDKTFEIFYRGIMKNKDTRI